MLGVNQLNLLLRACAKKQLVKFRYFPQIIPGKEKAQIYSKAFRYVFAERIKMINGKRYFLGGYEKGASYSKSSEYYRLYKCSNMTDLSVPLTVDRLENLSKSKNDNELNSIIIRKFLQNDFAQFYIEKEILENDTN